MAGSKGNNTAERKLQQVVVKHNGRKVRYYNMSGIPRLCLKCERDLGSGKMAVEAQEGMYCGWECSDSALAV